jgi:hypothetical protein
VHSTAPSTQRADSTHISTFFAASAQRSLSLVLQALTSPTMTRAVPKKPSVAPSEARNMLTVPVTKRRHLEAWQYSQSQGVLWGLR